MIGLRVNKFSKCEYEQAQTIVKCKEALAQDVNIWDVEFSEFTPILTFQLLSCGKPAQYLTNSFKEEWRGKHVIGVSPDTYHTGYRQPLAWSYKNTDIKPLGQYSYNNSIYNYYSLGNRKLQYRLSSLTTAKGENGVSYSYIQPRGSIFLGESPHPAVENHILFPIIDKANNSLLPTFINYLLKDKLQVQLLLNAYLHSVQNGNTNIDSYPRYISAFIQGLHIPLDLWMGVRLLNEIYSGTATEILKAVENMKTEDLILQLNNHFNNPTFTINRTLWNDCRLDNSKDNKIKGKLHKNALGLFTSVWDYETTKTDYRIHAQVILHNYCHYVTYLCGGLQDDHIFKQYMIKHFNNYYEQYIKNIPLQEVKK